MSKTKATTKGADKANKALNKVKDSGVTKASQSPSAKSKDIARKAAAKEDKASRKNKKKEPTPSSSSESESESESEESSSSESEEEKPAPKKETKKDNKKEAKKPAKKVESSSESESDSDEEMKDGSSSESESESESEEEKPAPKKADKKAAKPAAKAESSESESSESESESESEDEKPAKKEVKKVAAKEESDSSDSSDSESESEDEAPAKAKAEKDSSDSESGSDSSDSSDSESESEDSEESTKDSKKRKADDEPAASAKKSKTAEAPEGASANLFVGNLSWNVDEEWLSREFSEFGELAGCRVVTDRESGRSRGFGYVEYTNAADAAKAYEAKKGAELDNRPINLDYATGRQSNNQGGQDRAQARARSFGDQTSPASDTLFVGNLPFSATEDALRDVFSESGDIMGIRLPTDPESGRPKGFGYVQFSSVDEARAAHANLAGQELEGRAMRLDFSTPRPSNGERGGGFGGRGGGRGGRGGRGGGRGDFGGRGGRGGFGGRGGGLNKAKGSIPEFKGTKVTF
ncbi:hypothetical protein N7492_007670 [Penicillium capsulatum]|uniref:RRM domain-containing protein n=1 Tax=Penicillium capsulatum TaxID=69766 RepID=A0A9W9I078_9EURO|nr:hypothetical protein N7492_007670 [Penicillium capsulatum]KAJ6117504.1 hypothetical protein N7512_007229 [Penicillium capsulatum]